MPDDKAFQKQLIDIEKKKIEMGTNDKYNDKMTISDVPKSKNTIKINSNSTTTYLVFAVCRCLLLFSRMI